MSFTHTLLRIFFLFVVVFGFSTQLAFAAKYVTSGASGATISWDVVGAVNCTAGTTYPDVADNIYDNWQGSTRSASSNWGTPTILAAPGSDTTYTFWCTDGGSGATDSDTITVCGTGRYAVSDTGPCAAVVYGNCSATHYNCSAGTAANQTSISNGYTWNCNGAPNDVSHRDSCYECTGGSVWDGNSCEFVETYASCGGSAYTCSAGSYAGDGSLSEGAVNTNGAYSWTCNGYPNDVTHRASCNLACGTAIPTHSISWTPASVTTGQSATVAWSASATAASCQWTRTKPVVGLQTDTGYTTNGSYFRNNGAGWAYGTVDPCDGTSSSCNGDTWTIQCKNSCNGYSAQASASLTVAPPDVAPVGALESVSSGSMAACGLATGWTYDSDASSTAIAVHFYLDGAAGVGTRIPGAGNITTDVTRGDINTAYSITGDHGFSYQLPNMMPGAHTLHAYAYSTVTQTATPLLSGGGTAFTCTGVSPVVDAGVDRLVSVPANSIAHTGATATDSDGTIVSTVWTYVSGPGPIPTFTPNATTLDPITFGNLTATGVYTFRMTATDNHGLTSSDTMDVRVATDGQCAATHYSCVSGNSANNVEDMPGNEWRWDCNSPDGGVNASCTEAGFVLTTAITQTGGSAGTITPAPGQTMYASGTPVTVTIAPSGYVIPPTGASSALQSATVDGVTTTVNGVSTVPLSYNFTMDANHSVSATLYRPDPITTTITQNPSVYLGDSATVRWTTDGNQCNLYNWNGTVLIKAIGAVASSPTENQVTLTNAELPQTVNAFAYIMRCDDSTDINRGLFDANVTITLLCPRDPESYDQVTVSTCNNPTPVVGIAPGNQTIVLGQSVNYTSVATDASDDLVAHEMEWQKPNGTWSWQAPANGSVVYAPGDETLFPGTPKNTNSITATFTPTQDGVYFVRFVGMDDTLNNPALSYISNPNPRYYTSGGRLTYSGNYRLTVTTRVGANIQPDSGGKLRWTCFNADYGSITRSTDNFASTINPPVLSYRSLPPSTGTFTPTPGEAYRLLCETTIDSATFTYYPPSLTENSVTSTTADIAYNCNAPSAQSVSIQRISGMAPTSYSAISNPSFVDNGLDPQTNYTYVLRCYDGPLVGGTVSGNQIGYASLDITTENAIVDLNPIVISSYIRGKVADPSTLQDATTTDGGFFEWNYLITSGTPVSCTMQQRNDNGPWYPNPGYDTNTMAYTLPWSSLLASDKQAFVNGYQTKHEWRLSCVNPLGTITTETWSLTKIQPSIAVIDSITEGILPVLADVVFRCVPASQRYTIKDSLNVPVAGHNNQVYGGAVTFSPTLAGNYTITCDDGPPTVVLISATMWDPFFRLSGTQRTVGGATSVTLTWDISNPDATCRIWADVTIPPGCDATCTANRLAASSTINTILQTGNTDANDPYWPNGQGSRSITRALTEEAYNTLNARGRATINGIKYGMTFTGKCDGSEAVKVRVGITTTNEG